MCGGLKNGSPRFARDDAVGVFLMAALSLSTVIASGIFYHHALSPPSLRAAWKAARQSMQNNVRVFKNGSPRFARDDAAGGFYAQSIS